MAKRYLRRITPTAEQLQQYKVMQIFGKLLNKPNLWHFNRYSVAKAFSVGLFVAWIPVPFQMALAACGALMFNANLPISVALVWFTNPATMPPLFLFSYIIGAKVMGLAPRPFKFHLSWEWLTSLVSDMWQPFLLGCLICAVASAIVGNIVIRIVWRYSTIREWRQRNLRARKNST